MVTAISSVSSAPPVAHVTRTSAPKPVQAKAKTESTTDTVHLSDAAKAALAAHRETRTATKK